MIDVKSLRIGSWIDYLGKQVQCDINTIYATLTLVGESEIYKPIPLTPELLIKQYGFRQVNNNFSLPNEFNIFMVLIESTDEVGITVQPNGFIVSVKFPIKPFQYLHQLQNIYYDLMQTELPVN